MIKKDKLNLKKCDIRIAKGNFAIFIERMWLVLFKGNFVFLLILGFLVIGITGCGNKNDSTDLGNSSNDVATIIDNNGETQKMSAKELVQIYEKDEAEFKKIYTGADITVVGTFEVVKEKIDFSIIDGKSEVVEVYELSLKEGWVIRINRQGNEDFIAKLNEGDKLEVKGNIAMGWNGTVVKIFTVARNSVGNPLFNSDGSPKYEYEMNSTTIRKIN